MLIARGNSRLIADYGGVAKVAPVLDGVFLIAGLSSLALPGMSTFVSEFLVLLGVVHPAPGLRDHRHRRHHPGRALHPAAVPADHARAAGRRAPRRPFRDLVGREALRGRARCSR